MVQSALVKIFPTMDLSFLNCHFLDYCVFRILLFNGFLRFYEMHLTRKFDQMSSKGCLSLSTKTKPIGEIWAPWAVLNGFYI